jgi:hypothetical protein
MWKKILVVGTTTAAILGAGTAALAFSGSSSPTPAPTASTSTAAHAKAGKAGKAGKARREDLRHALHGSITTKAGKGATGYVTHDGIRGIVTAVSTSSMTVKAADGFTDTFVVTPTTVVHTKADGKSKGAVGQIASVRDGDKVGVLGTGTTTLTATHVVDATR